MGGNVLGAHARMSTAQVPVSGTSRIEGVLSTHGCSASRNAHARRGPTSSLGEATASIKRSMRSPLLLLDQAEPPHHRQGGERALSATECDSFALKTNCAFCLELLHQSLVKLGEFIRQSGLDLENLVHGKTPSRSYPTAISRWKPEPGSDSAGSSTGVQKTLHLDGESSK